MTKQPKTTQAEKPTDAAAMMLGAASTIDDAANTLETVVRSLSVLNGQPDVRLEVLSDRVTAYRQQAGELRAAIA